ncbi:MAG: uroporphyrinogen-III C-methyltransferase [Candidatus Magnetoovum sp. WYHC-5]|nr:uroporphyrinogen-III C-methyltransferase [Candidatus Magnetoovum sp. WYHC-5]
MNSTKKGKVYLVGAGPGDIGLLTLKGLRCLQQAQVVVYDYHVNPQILNFINEEAETIYAGKRGGHHAMTQDEINTALVKNALEGKTVCRLKGGDPFVFGRGGEEAQILHQNGIDFEIVPGVTSAISVPAYAGIPLTHRKVSSSFAVITGNEDETKIDSTINWEGIAKGFDTLVFLMAVKNMETIITKLIQNGKPAQTPTAVIRWGTRSEQETIVGTLGNITDLMKEHNITPPAVMVLGDVVKLREELNWCEKKPLFGQRIVITRRYIQEYERLERLGAEIFEYPTIEPLPPESYEELDRCIDNVSTYDWLVITSANGMKFLFNRIIERNGDIRDLKGIKVCAIGIKTAKAVKSYGIKVDLVPEDFSAEGLSELLTSKDGFSTTGNIQGMRFLLPRADVAREFFPSMVQQLCGYIDTPQAYRSVNPEFHSKRIERYIKEGKITIITFTSAATFKNLQISIGGDVLRLLSNTKIAAIGHVTKKAIESTGLTVDIIPKRATIEDMVNAIIDWCASNKEHNEPQN